MTLRTSVRTKCLIMSVLFWRKSTLKVDRKTPCGLDELWTWTAPEDQSLQGRIHLSFNE